jgi:electron transport complex protein RnfD
MATDYVTSPIGLKGKIIYAVCLGVLTVIIRFWGGYPEGVSYAIVFMNIFVPLIDRYIKDRIYGYSKAKKSGAGA